MTQQAEVGSWLLRKKVLALIVAGAAVQILVSAYYLGVGHAPRPHHVAVGYIADPAQVSQVEGVIDQGGDFSAHAYATTSALIDAIEKKSIYGGVDVTGTAPRLYVASAAGTAAATAIRTVFTAVVDEQVATQVAQLVKAGNPVPTSTLQALATPPVVTDVVPLPADDRAGSSLGLLVQALALGATIASLGLGRIGAGTQRSVRRGIGHVVSLVVYGAASAGAVLLAASWFGVIPSHAAGRLFLVFLLLSLAITASVAGFVAVVGAAGAILGTLYFTFGVIVSGASILPEFLPTWGRIVGQALPTGAGATAIRDRLYFPDASIAGPLAVLSAYAGLGIAIVLATNVLANRTAESSLLAERDAKSAGPVS